eukprot:14783927-Alexandrium_andersonii.AAC.1
MDTELDRTPHPEENRAEPRFTLDGITRRYIDPKFNMSRKVLTKDLDVGSEFFEVIPGSTHVVEPGRACARAHASAETVPAL